MFTEKQQEIADRMLKDLSANGYVWESDYMSELRMLYSDNYHDCDYVLQVMVSDYRLLERYGGGFLKLTSDGTEAARRKFMAIVKSEGRIKKVRRLADYVNLINAVFGGVIGSLLTLLIQKLLGII